MNAYVFTTERLIATRWDLERHVEAAFEMYGDPIVTRYIGGQTEPNLEAMRARIAWVLERDAKLGEPFGSFPLFSRETGALMGAALFKPLTDEAGVFTAEIEVGWHLPRRTWGQGYATEAGRALLDYAFSSLEEDELYAVVDPENERSMAVARRIGMHPRGRTTKYYGMELELFAITREEHRGIVERL